MHYEYLLSNPALKLTQYLSRVLTHVIGTHYTVVGVFDVVKNFLLVTWHCYVLRVVSHLTSFELCTANQSPKHSSVVTDLCSLF